MKTEGNDEKYSKLMEGYKKARRDPAKREKAIKLLKKAQDMDMGGLVSEDIVNAWRYLG